MNELVFNENGKALTSSLLVAKTFGKEHSRVMRDIRELACSDGFRLGNFADTSYTDLQGKVQPMFTLTRDGFTLLAMGYTGKKAMQFKESYIMAFNQMEQTIKNPSSMSELEILVQSAKALLEQSKRLDKVENRLDSIEQEREENRQLLLSADLSDKQLPEEGEKEKIRKLVDKYHKATGLGFKEIWDSIYATMEYRFKVRVRACDRIKSDKSWLDVAIRHNHGEKIFIVISDMVRSYNKNH